MENEKTAGAGKPFLQDPQKLTLAFGLSTGIAVMAIVALVIVAINGTNGTKKVAVANTNTAAVDTNSDTSAADATKYDASRIASAISGLDQEKFASCLSAKTYTQDVEDDISSATTAGVNGTPTSYINGTEVSGALPLAQVKTTLDAALNGTKGTANVAAVTKDDHVTGAAKPKVYIIVYSDFQCPYCQAYQSTLSQILADSTYKDKVAVVYRHFPLESIHQYARSLAEASECASAQGKFWEFHDAAFAS